MHNQETVNKRSCLDVFVRLFEHFEQIECLQGYISLFCNNPHLFILYPRVKLYEKDEQSEYCENAKLDDMKLNRKEQPHIGDKSSIDNNREEVSPF